MLKFRRWARRQKPRSIEILKSYLRTETKRDTLSESFEAKLYEHFYPQIEELEGLLGRSLSHWKRPND